MKLTLKEIRPETKDASTFIFTPESPVVYQAGQHISMMLPIEKPDNRGKVRPFTVSSSPTEDGILTITTKHGPSTFKQALFALPVGAVVDARGPGGIFVLDETWAGQHVFLAGGIGITPFRGMLKYVVDKKLNLPITLLYSNKVPEEIVFFEELNTLSKLSPHIHVFHTITKPESSSKPWQGRVGRIDEAFIREQVKDISSSRFYIAGPLVMVEAMMSMVSGLGVSSEHIRFEKFPGY